jgi:sugar lactone lactonase YvrE
MSIGHRLPCLSILITVLLYQNGEAAVLQNFAGTGVKGFSGDQGPAINARLNFPRGIALAPDGSLFICDTGNHRIRRVTANGQIETVAGSGEAGWSGDGGPAKEARLNEPYEVRFDSHGDVFWVERLSHSVRKLTVKTGFITTVAGNGTGGFSGDGGPATKAQLNEPHSIGFDKSGDLYICDVRNHRLRKVNIRRGIISTLSGTGERKAATEGATLAEAPLNGPRALDFDRQGNLILALREGNEILKLDLARCTVHHIGGTGKKGFTGDNGPAKEATMAGPKGVRVAPNGNIYFADTENEVIRVIEAKTGVIRTVAGTGHRGDGNATDPLKCDLSRPHGIFVDDRGVIYIGDSEAHRIRILREK